MKRCFLLLSLLLFAALSLCVLTACSLSDLAENPYFAQSHPDGGGTTETPDGGAPHTHTWGSHQQDVTAHWQVCTICRAESEHVAHTPVTDLGTPASCGDDGRTDGSHCEVCAYVLIAQEVIPATGAHSSVPCDLVMPTFTKAGCYAGEQCEVCGTITGGDHILPAFEEACGSYAYRALADKENGENMQAFYTALYERCVQFHTDRNLDAVQNEEDEWIAITLSFAPYQLTAHEAFDVVHAIGADCPLFYWIGNTVSSSGDDLYVYTDVTYAGGVTRYTYNQAIYAGMVAMGHDAEKSNFEHIFYLHDALTDALTYAYKSDGVTPEDAVWAHNILGYFTYKTGVCETYAETCQLFLNYWGIENVLVTGTADGGGHAWNMVQMDNAAWYWFDLTWDDQPTAEFGKIYDYFCKTDDGFAISARTVDTALYPVPAAGTTPLTPDIPVYGDSLTVGAFTYTVVGYGEAELFYVTGSGAVTVPAYFVYEDCVFDVVSVGRVEGSMLKPVFENGIIAVSLPASVRNIRGGAFSVASLTSVSIDTENPYLFSEGNVAIYTHGTCVLISYLPTAPAEQLTLRDDTVGIARFAILNAYLTDIDLPVSLAYIETYAFWGVEDGVTIHYAGTTAEWAEITLAQNALPTTCTIVCEDGTIIP